MDDQIPASRWGAVSAKVLGRPDLSPLDKLVYSALTTFADTSRECWPSQETVAAMLGIGRDTVGTAMKSLAAAGVLDRQRRHGEGGRRRSDLLTLNDDLDAALAGAIVPARSDAARSVEASLAKPMSATPTLVTPAAEQDQNKKTPLQARERAGEPEGMMADVGSSPVVKLQPIAPDWQPTYEDFVYAAEIRPDLDSDGLAEHTRTFVSRCLARGYQYRDWSWAWRSWLTTDWNRGRRVGAKHKGMRNGGMSDGEQNGGTQRQLGGVPGRAALGGVRDGVRGTAARHNLGGARADIAQHNAAAASACLERLRARGRHAGGAGRLPA